MNARKKLLAAALGLSVVAASALSPCSSRLGALAPFAERTAEAAIVERVVAVVGERPIFLTELRHRARPFLFRIAASTPNPAQQAAAETEMFRDLLNKMIDERLEDVAADKAHLAVSSDEVDTAIKNVSERARLSSKDLIAEAKRQGLTEQDYRDEIRRQVLEGKLVQLRVRGRVRVTDQDARSAYTRFVSDLGTQSLVEPRILALRVANTATPELMAQRETEAKALVERARGGEDFCTLVTTYSEDTQTKASCGSRGAQPLAAYEGVPPLFAALQGLKSGDVSDPVIVPGEAVLVISIAPNPKVPAYEDVKDAMTERAYGDSMERQRKLWLTEIRQGVYVDVRL